jgi:hypothetical protein
MITTKAAMVIKDAARMILVFLVNGSRYFIGYSKRKSAARTMHLACEFLANLAES